MFRFSNVDELRRLGAPVVRLFRIATGRDAEPATLASYAGMLAVGESLTKLAQRLLSSDAFLQQDGFDALAEDGLAARFCARAGVDVGKFPMAAMPAADYLAWLADSAEARANLDVLPGLVPGAAPDDAVAYQLWIAEHDSPPAESLAHLPPFAGPLVSLALVLGDSEVEALVATLASLQAQIYRNWELVIAPRLFSPWPRRRAAELAARDGRIKLLDTAGPMSVGAAWAQALGSSGGAFRGMLACADQLAPSALYEIMRVVDAAPETLMVYTDEDQIGAQGRSLPRFKAGYSPEAMQAGNLVGQLALYHETLLAEIGGLRETDFPLQAFALAARAARRAGPAGLRHVPAILYHRARPPADTDQSLADACQSTRQESAEVTANAPPLVSVIVPTRDRGDLLAICAAGVLAHTDGPSLELLIVDNDSTEPATLALFDRLQQDPRVRILRQPGGFNFAALCNQAALAARGSMILLLNNDVEVLEPGWLRRLVACASADGVGAAGAKLLYPDGTVQHAGIVLGPDGAATHVGRHAAAADPGYLGQFSRTRGLSAVTGACLAVKAAAWQQVGGMDERLAVTWNDIDLCLRLRAAGLRVVWTPEAVRVHHESATRGRESEDPAKLARFRAEQALMREIWGSALDDDPFLNPNLVAEDSGRLRLGKPRHLRPWEMLPRAT